MHRSRLRKSLALLLVALVVVALFAPAAVYARAGGGQSSNPGGSSSGGGFSGGSSGGGSSFGGGTSVIPVGGGSGGGGSFGTIVVIVIIIVVFLIIQNSKKGGGSGGGVVAPVQQMPVGPVSFDGLKELDPAFSEQAFYGRVNEMFMEIQDAWEARNMEPARRFLSAQQFEVLNNGVQELVRAGNINVLEGMHIDRIEPVSVTREGDADYVKIRITATTIDYTINEITKEIVNPAVLGDGKAAKTFQEFWTLTRKVGAQTKADASIRKCPNCGAPVTDGNYVKCAYCGTQMNDPALDWVLLRIEQP